MATPISRQALVWRSTVVAMVLSLGGGSVAYAHGSHHTCLSGLEISAGTDVGGGLTKDVTFVGIDNRADEDGGPNAAACDRWTTNGNGGAWSAKIDRVGNAGIGGSGVTVVGGSWVWVDADGRVHAGRVQGGYVLWPSALDQNTFGCGAGVAKFSITLSVRGPTAGGTFVGCLDDTHLPLTLPQPIWGSLDLS